MEPIKLDADGKLVLPQPDEITQREKDDAMGGYLMMFAAWAVGLPIPFANLIAAVIYYLINKKESRFVSFHAYQSMITQVIISLLNAGLIFWTIRNLIPLIEKDINHFTNQYYIVYLILVAVWNILYTVYSLIACAKAYKGKFFYMLLFGRLAFAKFYGKNAQDRQNKVETNAPPAGF